MSTVIYYYTGTGNSLWTARTLAEKLGDTELVPMHRMNTGSNASEADAVGLVFPVHIWGIPSLVRNFLQTMEKRPGAYYFAVAVNGGQVARTLVQLKELMAEDNLTLSAGFDIMFPSNYIPWGGPVPVERQRKLFTDATEKINVAASYISNRKAGLIEKGPMWQRVLFTGLYKLTYDRVKTLDVNFHIDGACSSCGICERVCPVKNITLEAGKPVWHGNCEQCLACIQWCPETCIQYGKKTKNYERYHHPEVKVKDVFRELLQ
ncbi:MAG: EFR1 family ferrodoxin [Desulfuromonadaceae bacterium]|nr:EFR1 family ferrodoxin [Desulfuromonadaceae bacterium]